jgi:CYTH domain-containing protein/thymidylate kinase
MFNGSQLIEGVQMIVLTGGPCSGKSSSLAYLTEKLSDHGFLVFVIPETATLITNNGIDRRKMDRPKQVVMYEEAILDMQLSFEETYQKAVTRIFPEKKKVILLDRGVMDIKAFVPRDDFKEMLKRRGLKQVNLRDRYNGVIHLVTAADGAAEHYTGENNKARIETAEEAILIDRRVREGWLGHPRFKVIDNRTDFEGKMERTFAAVSNLLGLPASTRNVERFIVTHIDYDQLPAHQIVEIEQTYLRSRGTGEEIKIKKRGQDGSYLYFLTRARAHEGGMSEEELISEQQYLSLRKLMDPKTKVLVKDRICFLWNNQHFEIDRYRGEHEGLVVFKVEPPEGDGGAPRDLPPFVVVGENVTHKSRYRERILSTNKRKGA